MKENKNRMIDRQIRKMIKKVQNERPMRKGMNFDQLKLNLQGEVTLNYGKFISTVINFLITYKGYNSAVEFSIIG